MVNEKSLRFFMEFEEDAKAKQHNLILELEKDSRVDKANKIKEQRVQQKKKHGLERM